MNEHSADEDAPALGVVEAVEQCLRLRNADGTHKVPSEARNIIRAAMDRVLSGPIIHASGCSWEASPYCDCGADPERVFPSAVTNDGLCSEFINTGRCHHSDAEHDALADNAVEWKP